MTNKITFKVTRRKSKRSGRMTRKTTITAMDGDITPRQLLMIAAFCVRKSGDAEGLDRAREILDDMIFKSRRIINK